MTSDTHTGREPEDDSTAEPSDGFGGIEIADKRNNWNSDVGIAEERENAQRLADAWLSDPMSIYPEADDPHAGRRPHPVKVAGRVMHRERFRFGPDGALWRYHPDGQLKGCWTADGENRLKAAILHAAPGHHTAGLAANVKAAVVAHLHGLPPERGRINDPDVPRTMQDENRILFANGSLRWDSETLTVGNANSGQCVTSKLPVRWDTDAVCPEFDAWLDWAVPDPAQQTSLMEVVAQAMAPRLWVKQAVVLVGPKNSGKTLFTNVLRALIGTRNCTAVAPSDVTLNRFASSGLLGKLANIVGDMSPRSISDPAKFKALTGGDLISGERKGKDAFQFVNNALFVCSANELPGVKERSEAFFDRFHIIRFGNQIDNPDPQLLNRLTTPEELAGLARRAVPYLTTLRSQAAFTPTDASRRESSMYQTETDPVKRWAERHLGLDGDDHETITKSELFDLIRVMTRLGDSDIVLGRRLHEIGRQAGVPLKSGQICDADIGERVSVFRGVYLQSIEAVEALKEIRAAAAETAA